jgi:hypothetical protein
VIDAHPEDIAMLDFVRPDGTRVMRTVADYRQLNDALFHAGVGSGSQFEWEDTPNRLHFYVVERRRDASGVLSYVVAVRSLDGPGGRARGVAAAAPATQTMTGASGAVDVRITNTGTAGSSSAAGSSAFAYDVFRLSVAIDGAGWTADLPNALAAVKAGESTTVPVHIRRTSAVTGSAKLTVKAVSESDSSKTAVAAAAVVAK